MDDPERLLDELREVFASVDPVPEVARSAVRQLYTLRNLDLELAELTFDSLEDAVSVRSPNVMRFLTFSGGGITLQLEIDDDRHRILGQVIPAQPATVEVVSADGTTTGTGTDRLGSFVLDDLPSTSVSLVCRPDDNEALGVRTEAFLA